ncbi:hypothetical protein OG205_16930 [Lentzea sp. NBC_00516]|uniref:hypothetical protein n=1 Tax=Lentzea sp. NBC_00516 TaxID=2903582 RepID=UPI002E823C15|nr:hypothetical protein [Lentzea sp. NBC_00516]WUD28621.1 hypothetical protein OG205_16930 [Lentzea sp. NBC_00516]
MGDVNISEDGGELYVNLNDKKLYVYEATAPVCSTASLQRPLGSFTARRRPSPVTGAETRKS